jgi:cysteine desulfurase
MPTSEHGYFDYNASSLLRPEAAAAMRKWIDAGGGNPSSMHTRGRNARIAMEDARRLVASLTDGAAPRDVVFTSGATESNNTVLRAFAAAFPDAPIVVSSVEHHSLVATAADLEQRGHRIVRLEANPDASLDFEPLRALDASTPCLVSLGLANGESGAVLDVAALVEACPASTFVHLDAAQAAGRIAVPFGGRIDALSMSGHKFGSPPGIGALFLSERLRGVSRPFLTGGPQEWALRAGTPNVPGIMAMGAAAAVAMRTRENEGERLRAIRDALWNRLASSAPDLLRITPESGLANTLTLAVADCNADSMIAALDLGGFSISAGSACAAGSPEPSHVMKALGLAERWHGGVLRISLGWATREEDAMALADALLAVVRRSREAA